jgi:hypothetical protein
MTHQNDCKAGGASGMFPDPRRTWTALGFYLIAYAIPIEDSWHLTNLSDGLALFLCVQIHCGTEGCDNMPHHLSARRDSFLVESFRSVYFKEKTQMKVLTILAALATASVMYAQNPLSAELKTQYNASKDEIMKSAERMPEADYSFKPAEGNTRTFGQIIGHIADAQMAMCSAAKGEQKRGNAESTKTSKADLTAALKESFDYCDGAVDSLTDSAAAQMTKLFGRDESKLGALYSDVIHNNEMYGQIVAYYRAKNMVPPSTADRPARGGMKKKG